MNTPEAKVFEIKFRQTGGAIALVDARGESLVTRRFYAAYHQIDGPWLIFKSPLHKPIFQVQQHLVETIEEIAEREDELCGKVYSGEMSINAARRAMGHKPWPLEFADRKYVWSFKDGPVLVDNSSNRD